MLRKHSLKALLALLLAACLATGVCALAEGGTQVTFYRRADGTVIGFHAEGHSGYATNGEDIVCAAISAVTQTTLLGLISVVKIPVTYDMDAVTGMLDVRVDGDAGEAPLRDAQLLFETLRCGLESIEAGYSDYLSVREEQVD